MDVKLLQTIFVHCCCTAVVMTAVLSTRAAAVGDDGRAAAAVTSTVKRSHSQCPEDGCTTAKLQCPHDPDACPLGLVPDGCGCCPYGVCGLGESQECNAADRPCANNLDCVKMENTGTSTIIHRCVCKEKEFICGSDNKTYSNECQLNEVAANLGTNGLLWVQYLGPCQSVPVIRSVPKNLSGSIGQPVVFDCEVKGYPVPSINWQFTDTHGIVKWLPGDDSLIAIQTRGGPDRLTVTSWVQIMEFKSNHAGNYTCLGVNSLDTVTASAILDIRQMT